MIVQVYMDCMNREDSLVFTAVAIDESWKNPFGIFLC